MSSSGSKTAPVCRCVLQLQSAKVDGCALCITYPLCRTNYPYAQRLKTTTCTITVSVGQESGHTLAGSSSSGLSHGYSHLEASLGRIQLLVYSCGCWQDSVLCRPHSVPHELLAGGLPGFLPRMGFTVEHLTSCQLAASEEGSEWATERVPAR